MRQENFKQRVTPDLEDVLRDTQEEVYKKINAVQIGKIEAFDPTDQTASVQIAIKQVIDEDPQGVRRYQDIALLLKVPVCFAGNSQSYLTIPVQVGDTCIVLFNDRDLENWFLKGGVQAPNTLRKHDFSDAVAIVGIKNFQNKIDGFFEDGPRLQYNDSNKVELIDGMIESTTPLLKQSGELEVTQDVLMHQNAEVLQNLTVGVNADISGNATVLGVLNVGSSIQKAGGGGGALPVIGDFDVQGAMTADTLSADNGATGTFTSQDGKTITVTSGIITEIA